MLSVVICFMQYVRSLGMDEDLTSLRHKYLWRIQPGACSSYFRVPFCSGRTSRTQYWEAREPLFLLKAYLLDLFGFGADSFS